jgi:hypothetical protein
MSREVYDVIMSQYRDTARTVLEGLKVVGHCYSAKELTV